jgi:hypothetical protein
MIRLIKNNNLPNKTKGKRNENGMITEGSQTTTIEPIILEPNPDIKTPLPDSTESGLLDVPEFYTTKRGRKLEGKRLETFNNFWDAFNFKNGKAEAADAWLNIPQLTDKLVDVIINAAKLEAQKRPDIISKGNTPKWAQGWLTGKRWEDEGYQEPIKPKITMFKVNDDE